MKVLLTDYDFLDISLERDIFGGAGMELIEAQCRTEQQVIDAARDCRALLVQYAPVTERVFAALPRLGICSRLGAGYDTIDAAAAARHGVWVANSPDYGVGEVATHALALMLACMRNVVRYDRDIHEGRWHYTSAAKIPRASNLTLGILGLGRIGKRFAHLARNLFGRVVAHDPYLIDGDFPAYAQPVSLEGLFETADAISIHCLLNEETRGMVGEALLGKMKPGSYLVNTARGAVLDADALARALQQDKLAAVGLDVLPIEPIDKASPLLKDKRVILSPHAAFYSAEAEIELRRKAVMNIVDWMKTGRPSYPVVRGTRKPQG
ncbi:MAG: C-terminal binding protein [Deltaproteobacteria bacterium]|nr:C-terminal binding protein [Deltaproteobacteria bacterium]